MLRIENNIFYEYSDDEYFPACFETALLLQAWGKDMGIYNPDNTLTVFKKIPELKYVFPLKVENGKASGIFTIGIDAGEIQGFPEGFDLILFDVTLVVNTDFMMDYSYKVSMALLDMADNEGFILEKTKLDLEREIAEKQAELLSLGFNID